MNLVNTQRNPLDQAKDFGNDLRIVIFSPVYIIQAIGILIMMIVLTEMMLYQLGLSRHGIARFLFGSDGEGQ